MNTPDDKSEFDVGAQPVPPVNVSGERNGQNVSFQNPIPLRANEPSSMPSHYQQGLQRGGSNVWRADLEANPDPAFRRKKSLVRPDRERIDPSHRQWFYRNHVAHMDANAGPSTIGYMPSSTGHLPHHGAAQQSDTLAAIMGPGGGVSHYGLAGSQAPRAPQPQQPARNPALRRGKSILGRDEENVESGIHFLKRGKSMRSSGPTMDAAKYAKKNNGGPAAGEPPPEKPIRQGCFDNIAPGPVGPWMIYCYLLTICVPSGCLKLLGMKTPEQVRAWREKMGLISVILVCMTAVGYITFGFTTTVCKTNDRVNITEAITSKNYNGAAFIHGEVFSFDQFQHKNISGVDPVILDPVYNNAYDSAHATLNLLFQKTGGACENILKPKGGSLPTGELEHPPIYMNCSIITKEGKPKYQVPGYSMPVNTQCHPYYMFEDMMTAKNYKDGKHPKKFQYMGSAFIPWENLNDPKRKLAIYRNQVLDFEMLNLLNEGVEAPPFFKELSGDRNATWAGKDVTAQAMRYQKTKEFDCIAQMTRIGFSDADTTGCIASKVELVMSMIFICSAVGIKFIMAVVFAWLLAWRMGNYNKESYAQRMKRMNEVEDWTEDIYRPAPAGYRPNVKKGKTFLPTTSRFTYKPGPPMQGNKPQSVADRKLAAARSMGAISSPPSSPMLSGFRSSASLNMGLPSSQSRRSSMSLLNGYESPWGPCPFPLHGVVPQPPPDYQPFNFPLVHTICLVTAYSESFEGLRTTLDSLATTSYPNSHKLILVIADGIVKGAESDISTPDICLSMMKDLVVPAEDVEGHSYVAIADGAKRHNMAKVYAGWYDYDEDTVEPSKQQRVPIVLVAKCGTILELDSAKPGNRGKRDSQMVLMAFLQKVLFDERMTAFEYEFFNAIWRVTGVTAEAYEIVLMVDADTKVFPDSLTRMTAAMVEDPDIMGLCGETKIANKAQSWVTMIQVFEYYISHHQTKGFEACFGGVTCLPGCFSAYRIKTPKGPKGYYVPILANPDIVEHYSENIVDTLHKKNLLLLGEDRYLSTLMFKTFPRRKMMFLPSAVCKTVVPDTFKVLRSQRRRWINSTVHNLFELILVRDLCGTFCFSMRFVVFMDLAGALVLPAAIAFTFYIVGVAIATPFQNKGRPDSQKKEFPTIPLVLLAFILGLPGVLIVITSRRVMYVVWMFVYLISLPIWNFALPTYAYWHMDDFSWGATRMVEGEKKGESHGDKEGEFDPNDIVMKRWIEFERERRWKGGIDSRGEPSSDRLSSPDLKSGNARYSAVSEDTLNSSSSNSSGNGNGKGSNGAPGPNAMVRPAPAYTGGAALSHGNSTGSDSGPRRLDAVPVLELPAPLGSDRARTGATQPTQFGTGVYVPRSRELSLASPTGSVRPSPLQGQGTTSPPPQQAPTNPFNVPPRPPYSAAGSGGSGTAELAAVRQHLFGAGPGPGGVRPPPPGSNFAGGPGPQAPPPPGYRPMGPGSPTSPGGFRPMGPGMQSPPPGLQARPGMQSPPGGVRPGGFGAPPPPGGIRPVGPGPQSPPSMPPALRSGPPSGPGSPSALRPQEAPMQPPMQPQEAGPPGNNVRPNVPPSMQRVNLVDDGPVAGEGGVRQVVRGARRQSSQSSAPSSANPFGSTK